MGEDTDIDPELLEDPIFQRVLEDALEIQDRFAAEPVYAKTGKGFLKSSGVEELKKIKDSMTEESAEESMQESPGLMTHRLKPTLRNYKIKNCSRIRSRKSTVT